MTRYPDWATRLEVYLCDQRSRQFSYGDWDCCLFVCDAIKAMTGEDPASWFRGKYDSAESAAKMIRSFCYGSRSVSSIVETMAARHKMHEVDCMHARRGDVALIKRGRDYSLGLLALDGKHLLVAGATGFLRIPRIRARRFWMV